MTIKVSHESVKYFSKALITGVIIVVAGWKDAWLLIWLLFLIW